jgi:hypothetical protein
MRIRFWAASTRLASILKLEQSCYLPVVAIITVVLSAQVSPASSDLPSNQQVIAFLTESIDWYHQCAIERQLATEPSDLVFLEDNRASAAQVLQLSFDFARADANAAGTQSADTQKVPATVTGSSDLAHLVQLENNTELQMREASDEIELIKKKLEAARGADHRELQAALDTAQSRLDVLQSGLTTLQQAVESVRAFTSREAGDLASTIDDLARTVPDATSHTSSSQTEVSPSYLSPKWPDSGILALSSKVSALGRKLSILDDEIRRTENLKQSSDALRNPLVASINRRLPVLAENALQARDLAELQQQRTRLDELATSLKALSPAIIGLDEQRVLLASYTSHLRSWRAAVVAEDKKTWQSLISRLLGTAVAIGALVIIGAVVHRVTRRHMGDTDRRHIALVIQRVVLWFTIVVVAAFAFASDLTSLATFFGLLAAGLAVALQSFILSAVSYFVLVGRRGIRIGDRVQISGVTGNVADIGWLQFQLKEIDTRTQQFTGAVVTFSNSIVLASPGTGLSKFKREDLKSEQLELAAKASQD